MNKYFDVCCGCGAEMPFTPTPGKNRAIRIWCEVCVQVAHPASDVDDEDEQFDVCPRCKVETKDLHPDDGLCPKCEEEWAEESKGLLDL